MTTEDAKAYLAKREIPQLFESLMTGLMYYRPDDHIDYLQDCLKKIRENGVDHVKWNLFIESRRKTPLPPIAGGQGGDNGRTDQPMMGGRDPSFITEPQSLEAKKGTPLPPIGSYSQDNSSFPDRIQLPNAPLVLVMGGPGSGRATHSKKLTERYPGWVHVSMGDILRQEIFTKGEADEKWGMVGTLVSKGEMAPEELTIELVKNTIQSNMNAKGIIVEGYPRNIAQVEEYEKYIGRVDLAFVLDCEEQFMQQRLLLRGKQTGRVDDNANAVASRIQSFKENTLPAIKYWDDKGKLVIVDGDRDTEEIFYELAVLFDNTFYGGNAPAPGAGAPASPRPPSGRKPTSPRPGSGRYSRPSTRGASRPGSGFVNVPKKAEISVTDSGRKADMPTCPVMFVMGGPGSGRGTQCKKLVERYPDFVHLSMGDILRAEMFKKGDSDAKWGVVNTLVKEGNMAPEDMAVDLVIENIKKHTSAKAIILEGYPRTQKQMEEFNQKIGGLSIAVLLDCDEYYMQKRLTDRSAETGRVDDNLRAIANRISFYKHNTLPILAHIDDMDKLVVVNGDRDGDEIFYDVTQVVDQSFYGSSGAPAPAPTQGAPAGVPSGAPAPGMARAATPVVERLELSVPDSGRKSGLPEVPIVAIIGAPGSGAEKIAKMVPTKYPDFVHIEVSANDNVSTLVQNSGAKAIVLEGFPKNKAQVEEFNSTVGGMSLVIVVDCDEAHARANAGDKAGDIDTYKANTLPVLGHFEDFGKLLYVNLQTSPDETKEKVHKALEDLLAAPAPSAAPAAAASSGAPANVMASVPELAVKKADTGRVSGLPAGHVVAVVGAPGSNSEAICKKLAEKFEANHLNAEGKSASDVASAVTADKLLILENFPTNVAQLEEFNSTVGGMCGVIVLDTSEEQSKNAGADDAKLASYKNDTLPVLGYFDDFGKLDTIAANKSEDEAFSAACTIFESALKSKTNQS